MVVSHDETKTTIGHQQTLTLIVSQTDIDDFRKALNTLKSYYKGVVPFIVHEELSGKTEKTFKITAEEIEIFYKLGILYGTVRQFKGK